jgi:DNA-directed RNA polymerase subunit K/omega
MTKPPEVIERENKEKALQKALMQKEQGKATIS